MQKIIIIILALMVMVISCTESPMEKNKKLLTGKEGYKYWFSLYNYHYSFSGDTLKLVQIDTAIDYKEGDVEYFDNRGRFITFFVGKYKTSKGIDSVSWGIKKIRSVCHIGNDYYEYKFINDSTILINHGFVFGYKILKLTEDTFRYILFRQDPNNSIHYLREECLIHVSNKLLPKAMRKHQRDEVLEYLWLLQMRYDYKRDFKKDW